MTAQTTKNILKIVAKNAAIGNFSDLFVAKTAMLARVFKEKRIKVTIIYNVINISSFRLKKFYHKRPTFARKSSTSFGAGGGSITLFFLFSS
jgi:hypothetical protein